eukprot:g1088.t1
MEWPPSEAWLRSHALCGGDAGADTITCSPLSGGFIGALILARRIDANGQVLASAVVKRAPPLAVPLFQEWRLHAREIAFYKTVAPQLRDHDHAVVPECIYASLDGGVLVLEDLTQGRSPVLADGMSEPELAATLRSLAALHAVTWVSSGAPAVAPLGPLEPLERGAFEPLINEQIPRFVAALSPHGRALVGAARWDEIVDQLQRLAATMRRSLPPRTIVHGDVWTGNVLLGVGGTAAPAAPAAPAAGAGAATTACLVDLQFAAHGHPMADVAMLIASSAELGPARGRGAACQRLIEGYAAELQRCFWLRGEAPPAGAAADDLLAQFGPALASSGLTLVVASFDTWWGMDESPVARARLAERWAAVCVEAAQHI